MRRLVAVLLLVLVSVSGCVFNCVWGSNVNAKETRQMPVFEQLDVRSGVRYSIELNNNNTYAVTVEGDDNLVALLKTEVINKTLIIGENRTCVLPKAGLKVKIHMPNSTISRALKGE
jgi:hypothetical protein